MRWIKTVFLAFFILIPLQSYAISVSGSTCKGEFFEPWKANLSNIFPITFAGVSIGGGSNPPTLKEDAICMCPSHVLPTVVPGIGVTYHEPLYLVESTKVPGCIHTLGGVKLLSGFDTMKGSGKTARGAGAKNSSNREQIHWMEYPLFAILDLFTDAVCQASSNGFSMGYMTELDPVWQSDLWSNVLSPESVLFANPIAQAACAIDAVSAMTYYPQDALFWCAGGWGSMYPFSGNPNTNSSAQQSNGLVLAKYLARSARLGVWRTTIGPKAKCFSTFNPIFLKTQVRVAPVYPKYQSGKPIYIGAPAIKWGYFPPLNYQMKGDSGYLLFIGTQCCLRP